MEEGDTHCEHTALHWHCSGGHMSTGFIGAWSSYFQIKAYNDFKCYLLNASQFLHVFMSGRMGEGKIIIGSDPCKLLAELLSP